MCGWFVKHIGDVSDFGNIQLCTGFLILCPYGTWTFLHQCTGSLDDAHFQKGPRLYRTICFSPIVANRLALCLAISDKVLLEPSVRVALGLDRACYKKNKK